MTWKLNTDVGDCEQCHALVGTPFWENETGEVVCSLECGEAWDRAAEERARDSDHYIPEGYHEQ